MGYNKKDLPISQVSPAGFSMNKNCKKRSKWFALGSRYHVVFTFRAIP